MRRTLGLALFAAACSAIIGPRPAGSAFAADPRARRPLALDDLDRVLGVADPRVSPDGQWVAYTAVTPSGD